MGTGTCKNQVSVTRFGRCSIAQYREAAKWLRNETPEAAQIKF